MLFNSFEFIFVFLPLALAGYFLLGRYKLYVAAQAWVAVCSLLFYSWNRPRDLLVLVPSILINYLIGRQMSERIQHHQHARSLLVFGVTANLLVLGYFKYSNFIRQNLEQLFPATFHAPIHPIALPLGISFFTFLQIGYLVDSYRRITRDYDLVRYSAFVSFFPHLIAGPILHHAKIIPQMNDRRIYSPDALKWQIGLTFFVIGLFKKVVIADTLAAFSGAFFDGSMASLSMFGAWIGVLSYTFQLYFDFSGYSDMAIGLGFLFGIVMPSNFLSPYKAKSITDFWRRWHITLSAFLREYLYIPLGGNRRGKPRQMVNLMVTMGLAGLWHGAGWGFVVWGIYHGTLLILNHLFTYLSGSVHWLAREFLGRKTLSWGITFLLVIVGWVFFRSHTLAGGWQMLITMFGQHGLTLPPDLYSQIMRGPAKVRMAVQHLGITSSDLLQYPDKQIFLVGMPTLAAAFVGCMFFPNAFEITSWLREQGPDGRTRFQAYEVVVSTGLGIVAYVAISQIGQPSVFLYFQF